MRTKLALCAAALLPLSVSPDAFAEVFSHLGALYVCPAGLRLVAYSNGALQCEQYANTAKTDVETYEYRGQLYTCPKGQKLVVQNGALNCELGQSLPPPNTTGEEKAKSRSKKEAETPPPPPKQPKTKAEEGPTSGYNNQGLSGQESELANLINQYRQSRGLPPLSIDSELMKTCRNWAQTVANNRWQNRHSGGNFWENAYHTLRNPQHVMFGDGFSPGWVQSPSHDKNLRQGGANTMAVCVAYDSTGTPYWYYQAR